MHGAYLVGEVKYWYVRTSVIWSYIPLVSQNLALFDESDPILIPIAEENRF